MVTKRHEWVERTEIGYWILDIGVGMGSNNQSLNLSIQSISHQLAAIKHPLHATEITNMILLH